MTGYALRRLLIGAPTLFIIISLSFFLMHLAVPCENLIRLKWTRILFNSEWMRFSEGTARRIPFETVRS